MCKSYRSVAVAAMLIATTACVPSTYTLYTQISTPSKSGLDLGGKTISIVSLEPEDKSDTTFCHTMAEALATNLEKEYFDSSREIPVYRMPADPSAVYSQKDTLVSLIMQTGTDIVVLQDTPRMIASEDGKMSFTTNVYAYDSLNPEDKVVLFQPKTDQTDKGAEKLGKAFGAYASGLLVPQWRTLRIKLYWYDDESEWADSVYYAENAEWNKAMDIWLKQAVKGTVPNRAAACYNMAVACYILRDYDLAMSWAQQSLALAKLEQTPSLIQTIQEAKNKK